MKDSVITSFLPHKSEVEFEKPKVIPQSVSKTDVETKYDPPGSILALVTNSKVDCEDDDNHYSPGAIVDKNYCEDTDTHDPPGSILAQLINNKNQDDCEDEADSVSDHPPASLISK